MDACQSCRFSRSYYHFEMYTLDGLHVVVMDSTCPTFLSLKIPSSHEFSRYFSPILSFFLFLNQFGDEEETEKRRRDGD